MMPRRNDNATVSVQWTPPPAAWLVYNNCSAGAQWLAAYSSNYKNDVISWTGVSMDLVSNYLRSMIPSNWTRPTDAELLAWYQQRSGGLEQGGVAYTAMIDFVLDDCDHAICSRLEWQGDPDLAGVGAMISYAILVVFTTLYFVVLFIDAMRRLAGPTKLKRRSKLRFFTSGFEKSLCTFQDAVLLFSISINVAAMTRWLAPVVHPNTSHPYYGLVNSVFMSSFSVFPALALQSLTPGLHHRRGIRLFLWCLTIVFMSIVEVYYRSIYLGDGFLRMWEKDVQWNEDIWLLNCDNMDLREVLGYMTMAGHIFLTVNCLWWLYHATAPIRRGRHVQVLKDKFVGPASRAPWRARWERWQVYLRLGNGLAALIFMWLFMVFFTLYREGVRERAGSADQDSQWTFGQVLSLATWAPVGVELITVYIYESKDDGDESRPSSSGQRQFYDKGEMDESLENIPLNEEPWRPRLADYASPSPIPSTYAAVRTHSFV